MSIYLAPAAFATARAINHPMDTYTRRLVMRIRTGNRQPCRAFNRAGSEKGVKNGIVKNRNCGIETPIWSGEDVK
jgi:hypothetical protein